MSESALTDKIWEAVEHAVDADISPDVFRREVRAAWSELLRRQYEERAKVAAETFTEAP